MPRRCHSVPEVRRSQEAEYPRPYRAAPENFQESPETPCGSAAPEGLNLEVGGPEKNNHRVISTGRNEVDIQLWTVFGWHKLDLEDGMDVKVRGGNHTKGAN